MPLSDTDLGWYIELGHMKFKAKADNKANTVWSAFVCSTVNIKTAIHKGVCSVMGYSGFHPCGLTLVSG